MAGVEFNYSFNWRNTLQRRANTNDPVGYITSITVSPAIEVVPLKLSCPYTGTSAESGFTPLTLEDKGAGNVISCAAAIESFSWDSGQMAPITIRAYFHKDNTTNLRTISSPDISLGFWMLRKESQAQEDAKNTWYEWFLPAKTLGDSEVQWSLGGKLKEKVGGGSQNKFEWEVDPEVVKVDGREYIGVTFTMMPAGKKPVHFRIKEDNTTSTPRMHDWGNEA